MNQGSFLIRKNYQVYILTNSYVTLFVFLISSVSGCAQVTMADRAIVTVSIVDPVGCAESLITGYTNITISICGVIQTAVVSEVGKQANAIFRFHQQEGNINTGNDLRRAGDSCTFSIPVTPVIIKSGPDAGKIAYRQRDLILALGTDLFAGYRISITSTYVTVNFY